MVELRFAGIIPARFASTRFPGKPLALIGGKTMIQRVYDQAQKALDAVFVATDDQRIADEVKRFGGKVIMTSPSHPSGTDRCWEAYTQIGEEYDVVINIQGDEPFIDPSQIKALMNCFDGSDVDIATLIRKIDQKEGIATLLDPNKPKVVVNNRQEAIYFSRLPIPYLRNVNQADWLLHHDYFSHIGIYAYRTRVLKEIVSLSPTTLEMAESLEQLRWIENGYRIRVAETDFHSIGIDTPEDLEKVSEMYS